MPWLYFDDFPRTVVQAKKVRTRGDTEECPGCNAAADHSSLFVCGAVQLDKMLTKENTSVDAVVINNVPDKVLVDRIAGQRVHVASGRSNHVKVAPPNVDGKEKITGEPLIPRKDDNEVTLGSRLEDFYKQTQPVIDFNCEQGKLVEVNAHTEMHKVTEQIRKSLGSN